MSTPHIFDPEVKQMLASQRDDLALNRNTKWLEFDLDTEEDSIALRYLPVMNSRVSFNVGTAGERFTARFDKTTGSYTIDTPEEGLSDRLASIAAAVLKANDLYLQDEPQIEPRRFSKKVIPTLAAGYVALRAIKRLRG